MKIKDVIAHLEELAPPALQESYDNSGLIVGEANREVTKTLICLDAIEEVVDEAIRENCNLIIAHHPIVFRGLKRFNGSNYVERTVIKAIKNDIAIYAIHTNLDNVLAGGVNQKIAQKLGLQDLQILRKREGDLCKLVCYVPSANKDEVLAALHQAGAGSIGEYENCSFEIEGTGNFTPKPGSAPFVGEAGRPQSEREDRIEVIVPSWKVRVAVSAMKKAHPYEEVAYDLYAMLNENTNTGSGIIGNLAHEMSNKEFLSHLKNSMGAEVVKYTSNKNKPIRRVAICGGSGSFLIGDAKRQNADVYVTGDIKYHEFFDGENEMMICDIGHYESEHFTIELLGEFLSEKIASFAVVFTSADTNPVKYYH